MTVPLLETKFHIPPVRPEYVKRQRLIDRLNISIHRKLTLISAPAGFGKTSLISEWIMGSERQPAWLSLDKRDNDPIRFMSYLIGALHTTQDQPGSEALNLIQSSPQTAPELILTALINELASKSRKITLVFDDYHVIENQDIDEMLDFMIEHLPTQLHLVISTREDPQLSLSRLRASGKMNELRASDLRFIKNEIAQFMNDGMKLELSSEDIGSLEQRTEGWIASLQLAALSLQKQTDVSRFIQSFTGSNRLVLDYLVEEVLRNQKKEIQDFLIRTSVLDRMCASLCDELTGRKDGKRVLEVLDSSNLFIIPLDDERRWYRYHHLFAELLHQHLGDTQSDDIPLLHGKAGKWLYRNGFIFESIEHKLLARDFEDAVVRIETYLGENFEKVTQATRKRWLEAIPEDFLGTRPYLALFQAWSMIVAGQLDIAERCIRAVESSPVPTGNAGREDGIEWTQCQAMASAFRSFIESYRGNFDASILLGNQALHYHHELMKQHEHAEQQNEIMRPRTFALIVLAYSLENAGRLGEAEQTRKDAISAAKQLGDEELIGFAGVLRAESLRRRGRLRESLDKCRPLLYNPDSTDITENPKFCWLLGFISDVLTERGEKKEALEQAELAMERTSRCEDAFYIIRSSNYIVRTLFSYGEIARAREAILTVERLSERRSLPQVELHIASAWKARLLLAEGKLEEAGQWAEEHSFDTGKEPSRLHEAVYFALARIWMAQGHYDKAIMLLEWAGTPAESDNRVCTLIESLTLQALAVHRAGGLEHALELLKRALLLAEPLGFIRIFVDEGPSLARLLYEAAKQDIQSGYIRRLLAEFTTNEAKSEVQEDAASEQKGLMEPLSERELDVLRLVAEGMSNERIGETLFISVHTVKVHTRNIYAKLDTHNRTEAVARARNYGILNPD